MSRKKQAQDEAFTLRYQEVRLDTPKQMQPKEEKAVLAVAHYAKNADDYYDLLDKLNLTEALERVRGYGAAQHTLRCV